MLDKFNDDENIFDESEKLRLLLHFSRDPYQPRSSAKYIPHMSALIENMFNLNDEKESDAK